MPKISPWLLAGAGAGALVLASRNRKTSRTKPKTAVLVPGAIQAPGPGPMPPPSLLPGQVQAPPPPPVQPTPEEMLTPLHPFFGGYEEDEALHPTTYWAGPTRSDTGLPWWDLELTWDTKAPTVTLTLRFICWLTEYPSKNPQYQHYGREQQAKIYYVFPWTQEGVERAAMFGKVLMGHYGTKVHEYATMSQYRIVRPEPPSRAGIYNCGPGLPGIDAVKNAACGRWRGGRDPLPIWVRESQFDGTSGVPGDWYNGAWMYAPLSAGQEPLKVYSLAWNILFRINDAAEIEQWHDMTTPI